MWNRHSVRWRSRRSRSAYGFERAITFDQAVGSPSNLYRRFRMQFSMEQMWNRHSVRWRSRRSRSPYGFERPITFDQAVGSPSNL
jgi:hypothetical protein